jgi:hypothetical protein
MKAADIGRAGGCGYTSPLAVFVVQHHGCITSEWASVTGLEPGGPAFLAVTEHLNCGKDRGRFGLVLYGGFGLANVDYQPVFAHSPDVVFGDYHDGVERALCNQPQARVVHYLPAPVL